MKVSICEKCPYYKIGRWVTYHKPLNYHPIGITHRYGYCEKYKKRCFEVKKCDPTHQHEDKGE